MKYLMAPLEGVTYTEYRNLLFEMFGGFSQYYAPFISPDSTGSFKEKFLGSLLQHPDGMDLVPQIMTNNADAFVITARKLADLGFEEINLNAGCPSGTVFTKHKGAGMLADPDGLDRFLDTVFSKTEVPVSIKTRLGVNSSGEFERLAGIYAKYPLKKLIVHARDRDGMYRSIPDVAAYVQYTASMPFPVCYNGNIFSKQDEERLLASTPETELIMLGRGVIRNPALGRFMSGGKQLERNELKDFLAELASAYLAGGLSGPFTVQRMKQLWQYMAELFPESGKELKALMKARSMSDYHIAEARMLSSNFVVV